MSATARRLWRAIDERELDTWVAAEFPAALPLLGEPGRREVLRAMAASLVLAGLGGCGDGSVEVLPYVEQPPEIVPGVARFFATAVIFEGYAQPVLAETHEGRPTKLEGNPQHPASGGATDAFTQAAILQLYDPDRSAAPLRDGRPASWPEVERAMFELAGKLDEHRGGGFRILTGDLTSPTMIRQLEALRRRWPEMVVHGFEPIGDGWRRAGLRAAFGRALDRQLALAEATTIVTLDDDILGPGPAQVAHMRGWAAARRAGYGRIFAAECTPGLTGTAAGARLAAAPSRIPVLASALAQRCGVAADELAPSPHEGAWIDAAFRALDAARGQGLLTIGSRHPPGLHALVHRINEALGNAGKTVRYIEPIAYRAAPFERLAAEIGEGHVETLLVLGANPVYAAPGRLGFAERLARVPTLLHAGLYVDETGARAQWHMPLAHDLEGWGDARAVDGTATILQPVIRPFLNVRTGPEILALVGGEIGASPRTIVEATWRDRFGDALETRWRQSLHDGFVAETSAAPVAAQARVGTGFVAPESEGIEIVFAPDPTIWDGRFANLAWLQELPKPLSKLTWDNVVALSPETARSLGAELGDMVRIEHGGRAIEGPAWPEPGQPDGVATLFLGYGRRLAGRVGDAIGYDGFALRDPESPWLLAGASLARTGERHRLATTQMHGSLDGFDLVRRVAARDAAVTGGNEKHHASLYEGWPASDPAWGMVIDLDLCVGCNACVVACQAENNVPPVGKSQVEMGREMHWLRIDRYYAGPADAPETYFQPVPCMHCQKAPCEIGCPVHATVHGPEGLNEMVYNRCIGTRTCSSYCPYKVRRFNWYDYTRDVAPSIEAQRNPDVTVRGRGVMEKCSYCIQRINGARIAAQKEGRAIRDGEVVTACQAACPSGAIVFGNLADAASAVAEAAASPRNYTLLNELDTRPRTTYLARVSAGEDEA
jgi:molybdopterin-containing oxidoreductase family iron-sulfur binding subunit